MNAYDRRMPHTLTEQVLSQIENDGCQARVVSIRRAREITAEIEERRRGSLDTGFYQKELEGTFQIPADFPDGGSLFVIAVPQPQVVIRVVWRDAEHSFVVPPTYARHKRVDERVRGLIQDVADAREYLVARATLPLKLLAVRAGLAAYGKNNITYVPGMGSFHRLVGVVSDVPCEKETWREVRLMDECEHCLACRRSCPSGAISSERFLLHAEKCVTFLNEWPGDFPDWVDPAWHNCLIGCMRCQRICPQNKGVIEWTEDSGQISEDEAGLLVENTPLKRLPASLVEKLEQMDLVQYLDVLPRNLKMLLDQIERGERPS